VHCSQLQVQEHIALHGIVRVRRVRKVLGLFDLEVRPKQQQQQQQRRRQQWHY
jgi:hypothetical protein